MNVILGAIDVSSERIAAAHRAADQMGVVLDEHLVGQRAWVASASDGGAAIRVVGSDGGQVVAYGSGVPTIDDPDLAGDTPLLDGQDPDLVAIRATSSTVTVAAGAGNHRLFEVSFPEGGTMVSSNLGLIARVCGSDLRLDRGAEDFLLGFGFLPDERTPYRDICAVSPGSRRQIDAAAEVEAVVPAARDETPPVQSFDAAVDELHRRFLAVVEAQAGNADRHAVLLGGFDSALVAATLRTMGHDVSTFTFGFGDQRYEQANVDLMVRELGLDHTWVRLEPDVVFDGIVGFRDHFPQPGSQPHYQVHTLIASERIRRAGHTAVFSGDGCDAVFLGYPTVNTRARIVAGLSRLPAPIVSAAMRGLTRRTADRHLGHVARMARSALDSLSLPWPARGHLPTQYLDAHARARLRGGDAPPQDESVTDIRLRLAEHVSHLDRTRLAYHGSGLTGQSRAKVDGSVASTGVVQRSPYLDPGLKAFVSGLPTEYLRPPGAPASSAGKALLVEMARRHRLLPDEIIDMPKQSPSDSPIDSWYAGQLRDRVFELLGSLPFDVDVSFVEEMLRPKRAEDLFRNRVSLAHHALQPIGLMCAYASFAELASA